jgi:hypothetical protein
MRRSRAQDLPGVGGGEGVDGLVEGGVVAFPVLVDDEGCGFPGVVVGEVVSVLVVDFNGGIGLREGHHYTKI